MKNKLLLSLSGLCFAAGLVACSKQEADDSQVDTTASNVVNFVGVESVSFNVDTHSITTGQKWSGILNNQSCIVDSTVAESDLDDQSDDPSSDTPKSCSALNVRANLAPGVDANDYLTSNGIKLFNEANNLANLAFGGTLNFAQNGVKVSCDGLYLAQATVDGEQVWSIYDGIGGSYVPSYSDDDGVTLQCKNGGTIVLTSDDLPDSYSDSNTFVIDSYTLAQ